MDMKREYMTGDQRFAEKRPDVLTWQTDSLDHDVTLAGNIWANLKVSTTGTDADWVVKVLMYTRILPLTINSPVKMYAWLATANGTQRKYARQISKQHRATRAFCTRTNYPGEL
jgi:predicted acyl esterase